jgi:hypothetical protein
MSSAVLPGRRVSPYEGAWRARNEYCGAVGDFRNEPELRARKKGEPGPWRLVADNQRVEPPGVPSLDGIVRRKKMTAPQVKQYPLFASANHFVAPIVLFSLLPDLTPGKLHECRTPRMVTLADFPSHIAAREDSGEDQRCA